MVPMFEDCATTPRTVSLSLPCSKESVTVPLPEVMLAGTSTFVSGVTSPESVRAAMVNTFSVEPGS